MKKGVIAPKTAKPSPAGRARKAAASAAEVGRPAPAFTLQSGTGETISLKDFAGKSHVVLYFYPKDMTPGCTSEACAFRDRLAEIRAHGAVVLGVSPDSPASHAKFAGKYGLDFPLLADPDTKVAQQYVVWKEKSLYGRTFMGIERSTFLIGKDGKIKQAWRKVKVAGHDEEVLEGLEALQR